eukprot:SAG11_NODE_1374_length_5090_cov_8.176718_4_plen_52_part_00
MPVQEVHLRAAHGVEMQQNVLQRQKMTEMTRHFVRNILTKNHAAEQQIACL